MKTKLHQVLFSMTGLLTCLNSQAQIPGGAEFIPASNMNRTRIFPLVSSLENGNVVLFGGREQNFVSSAHADIYNPVSQSFTEVEMNYPHDGAAVVKLSDGSYMLAGGSFDGGDAPGYNTAEIFNPISNTFTPVSNMIYPRMNCSGAELSSGKVIISGGLHDGSSATYSEIYDPSTGSFYMTEAMKTPRAMALTLPTVNGNAVVFGGVDQYGTTAYTQVEYYSAYNNNFKVRAAELIPGETGWTTNLNMLNKPVADIQLSNGNYVFLAYRTVGTEKEYTLVNFDPSTEKFTKVSLNLSLTGFSGFGSYQSFVVNKAENMVYLIGFNLVNAVSNVFVTTIDLNTQSVFYPVGAQSLGSNEYPMASYSLLPENKILMAGISTSADDYLHATDKTNIINPAPWVSNVAAIDEQTASAASEEVLFYPNPTEQSLYIKADNKTVEILIRDHAGRIVFSDNIKQQALYQAELGHLTQGTYFVTLVTENCLPAGRQCTSTKKLEIVR